MPDEFIPPKTNTPKHLKIDVAQKEPPKEVLSTTFSMEGMPKTDGPKVEFPDKPVNTKPEKKDESTTLPKLDPTEGGPIGTTTTGESKSEPSGNKPADTKPADTKEQPTGILKPPAEKKSGSEDVSKKLSENVKPVNLQDKKGAERDYTGYSNDEVAHLKQMSNPAFEYVTKIIKENKELAKTKDTTFLQHPDAYILSPDYRETVVNQQKLSTELSAFEKALIACKDAKKFVVPTGYDKDGNMQYSQEIEPSAAMEVELSKIVNNTANAVSSNNQKLQSMSGNFKERVKSDLKAIQDERHSRFPWVKEPKLMDYTLQIEGVGDVSLKNIKDYFMNLVPPYYRNNPVTEVAADLFIALRIQDAEMGQLKSAKGLSDTKVEEAKRGEPSSEIKNAADTAPEIGGIKKFSLEGMPSR
jgi:hypothetical protein